MIVRRLFLLLGLPGLVFAFLAWLPDALALEIINSCRFSLSVGVLIAYLPGTVRIVLRPKPLIPSEIVLIGIVFAFCASSSAGAWWYVYQLLGTPQSMSQNTFVQFNLFLYCMAAIYHLVAPRAQPDIQIPPKRWISAGVLIGATVLIGIGIVHLYRPVLS